MDELNPSKQVKEFCLEKWWTYSEVTSPEEAYWECMFPSGIGCRDIYILNGECQYEANTEDIDTEEERQAYCEENIRSYFVDMMGNAELINIEYWDEEEFRDENWNLMIINREFTVRYDSEWQKWIWPWLCEANFVQWWVSAIFNQAYMDI